MAAAGAEQEQLPSSSSSLRLSPDKQDIVEASPLATVASEDVSGHPNAMNKQDINVKSESLSGAQDSHAISQDERAKSSLSGAHALPVHSSTIGAQNNFTGAPAPNKISDVPQSSSSIGAPAQINISLKRSVDEAHARADDDLSAHGSASDAEIERLASRAKLKKMEERLAAAQEQKILAELESARADADLAEAKANSSGGSHRSRSDHGTPVRTGLNEQQFADKMAQRKRIVEGVSRTSPAMSSLGNIDEGAVAPVPVLPAMPAFPDRAPSPRDSAERSIAMHSPALPPGKLANRDEHESVIDLDDYSRASAVQKQIMLKHKRPPTPPGSRGTHTPRSVVSVASTRTRAELAAMKLRLEQAER